MAVIKCEVILDAVSEAVIKIIFHTVFCPLASLKFMSISIHLYFRFCHVDCMKMSSRCTQPPVSLISLFSSYRSVSLLRSVAKMFVGIIVVWQPVTWLKRKAPWECPRKPPVPALCAPSRGLSVTSGTASRCVSAGTAARGSRTSPVHLTA